MDEALAKFRARNVPTGISGLMVVVRDACLLRADPCDDGATSTDDPAMRIDVAGPAEGFTSSKGFNRIALPGGAYLVVRGIGDWQTVKPVLNRVVMEVLPRRG